MSAGWLINSFHSTYSHINRYYVPSLFIQIRDYAARKGTREKAKKKKVKVIIEKVGFIPHNKRINQKSIINKTPSFLMINDSWKSDTIDDVWITKYHKRLVYSFEQAIENHRETHHPTMYNKPNADVNALIELDMRRDKKNKFVEKFRNFVSIPHPYSSFEDRKILAFSKDQDDQERATAAGATFVGGIQLIKQIQNGKFPFKEYEFIVANTNILVDLLLIRGLLRKQFPSMKYGNLGTNLESLVKKFKSGIMYTANPMQGHKSFGKINVTIGTLEMNTKDIEENLSAILNNVQQHKPRQNNPFILRVQIISPPSRESFKINFDEYLPEDRKKEKVDEDKDEKEDSAGAVIESI